MYVHMILRSEAYEMSRMPQIRNLGENWSHLLEIFLLIYNLLISMIQSPGKKVIYKNKSAGLKTMISTHQKKNSTNTSNLTDFFTYHLLTNKSCLIQWKILIMLWSNQQNGWCIVWSRLLFSYTFKLLRQILHYIRDTTTKTSLNPKLVRETVNPISIHANWAHFITILNNLSFKTVSDTINSLILTLIPRFNA